MGLGFFFSSDESWGWLGDVWTGFCAVLEKGRDARPLFSDEGWDWENESCGWLGLAAVGVERGNAVWCAWRDLAAVQHGTSRWSGPSSQARVS